MDSSFSRRSLLTAAAGVAAAPAVTAAEAPLPAVQFGPHKISKLVIGTNPLMGYSHFNQILDRTMRDWMTHDRRVSRTREEARALMNGEAPLGETFLEKDPDRMSQRIMKTKRPCFGFKILAAGRAGFGKEQIETAFKGAFARIKPNDAVIVGMWPKYKNEMAENAAIVRGLMAS